MTNGAQFVLALGAVDFGLEQSMIVPALPDFAQTYGASLIAVGWLATAYLLTAIVAVPLLSRLGDLYGKRRMISSRSARSPLARSYVRSRTRSRSRSLAVACKG